MKLSHNEHNIKKQLADREIQPSAELWNNIQTELDKEQESNSKVLWMRLAGIAAVLCVGFLAYQGFQNTREALPVLVLDQKEKIEQPTEFQVQTIDYVAAPATISALKKIVVTDEKSIENNAPQYSKETAVVSEISNSIDTEVESLIEKANTRLAEAEQEKLLITEVDNLLDQAIENTQDIEQQNILKSMQAQLLLAEVEADIDLVKPPNLKDKIWDAIVSNYTDLKNSVVLN